MQLFLLFIHINIIQKLIKTIDFKINTLPIVYKIKSPAEGIIADLHVIRVAPRIGLIAETKDGNKVEKQLMQVLPKEIWDEVGMAISFLGREICRPTNPKCDQCPIHIYCNYFKTHKN